MITMILLWECQMKNGLHGRFQYVSNYIVSEEENNNITWHTPRLTEDEWNDIYGGQ